MFLQAKILGILAVGAFAYFAVDSYRDMAQDLATEKIENSQLRDTVANVTKKYEDYGESVKKQLETAAETLVQVTAQYERSRSNVKALEGLLNDHNLTHLSLKKPGRIERVINAGTKRVFQQLEAASQSRDSGGSSDSSGDSKTTKALPSNR